MGSKIPKKLRSIGCKNENILKNLIKVKGEKMVFISNQNAVHANFLHGSVKPVFQDFERYLRTKTVSDKKITSSFLEFNSPKFLMFCYRQEFLKWWTINL